MYQEIHNTMKDLADGEDAKFLQTYFKTGKGEYAEGDRFLGIRVPVLRKLAKRYKDLAHDDINNLLTSTFHEQRMLALLILTEQFTKADEQRQAQIYRYYLKHTADINNWDLVDISAHKIVGAYLYARDRKPLYRLAKSKMLWERRIAIMATYHFIKQGDYQDTLILAHQLMDDPHDLIHKASGWMLREVGKRHSKSLKDFLNRHCRHMPRTQLRYAIEKLPKSQRQKYLAGNI